MPDLHELSTIIGNSAALGILSAVAAGLAALALLCGVSRVGRRDLPPDYPGDAEAQLDKYVAPFRQLEQAGKGSSEEVEELLEKLKSQPAAHLGLTAFQRFAASRKPAGKSRAAEAKTSLKGSAAGGPTLTNKPAFVDDEEPAKAVKASQTRTSESKNPKAS